MKKPVRRMASGVLSVCLLATVMLPGLAVHAKPIAPKMLSNCDSFEEAPNWVWYHEADASFSTVDTAERSQGTGSLLGKITPGAAGAMFNLRFGESTGALHPVDFTAYRYLEYDFWSEYDYPVTANITFYSVDNTDPNSGWTPDLPAPKKGWNHYKVDLSTVGKTADLSQMTRLRFCFWNTVGHLENTIRFDNVRLTDGVTPTPASNMMADCDTNQFYYFNNGPDYGMTTVDTENKTQGAASNGMLLQGAGATVRYVNFTSPLDITAYPYIEMDVWVDRDVSFRPTLRMSTGNPAAADPPSIDYWVDTPTSFRKGWNRFILPTSGYPSGGATLKNLNGMALYCDSGITEEGFEVKIDNLRASFGEDDRDTLSSLSIAGGLSLSEPFDSFNGDYTLTVGKSVSSLDILAVPSAAGANVAVSGNTNLVNGSVISVKVTSITGTQRIYTITVTKLSGDPPLMLNDCDSLDSIGAGAGDLSLDTVNSTQGRNSLKVTYTGDPIFFLSASHLDITQHTYLEYDLYCPKALTALNSFNFCATGTDGDGYNYLKSTDFQKGWNHIRLPLAEFNGTIDLTDINRIRFAIFSVPTGGALLLDNVRLTNGDAADEATLESLTLNNAGLSLDKAFDKYVTTYSTTVPTDTTALDLSYEKTNAFTSVEVTGNGDFVYGAANQVKVKVVNAVFGQTRTYTINVSLAEKPAPKMLHDFDTTAGLKAEADADTVFGGVGGDNSTQGQKSGKFTVPGDNLRAWIDFPGGADVRGYDTIEFDLWVDKAMTAQPTVWLLSPDGGNSRDLTLPPQALQVGWNKIKTSLTSTSGIQGTPELKNVTSCRIGYWGGSQTNVRARLDNFRATFGEDGSAYLDGLTIGNAGIALEPAFNKHRTEYTVTVPNETPALNLTATPSAGTTAAITGNDGFSFGEPNQIKVTVTNTKYGYTRTYVVDVLMDSEPNPILLHDGDSLTGVAAERAYQTTLNGQDRTNGTQGTGSLDFHTESNQFMAYFTSMNGNIRGCEYVEFDMWVDKAVIGVVNATLECPDSPNALSLGTAKSDLTPGWNHIKMKIADGSVSGTPALNTVSRVRISIFDGSVTGYDVKIDNIRATMGKDDRAQLSSLSLPEGLSLTPEFNANVLEYTLEVPSTMTDLDVTGLTVIEGSTIEAAGNKNLKKGQTTVTVTVKTPLKTVCVYTIYVQKDIYIKIDGVKDDKYTETNSVSIDNTYKADGVTPGDNVSGAAVKVYYAYDEDYIYFYTLSTQDSINPLRFSDYSSEQSLFGNLMDHLEFWVNPDPTLDMPEMNEANSNEDMMDVSPRFFAADGKCVVNGTTAKVNLFNSSTYKIFKKSETQYGVEFKYPRDKTESSFKFTVASYVSDAVLEDGVLKPTKTEKGFYNVAPVGAWWRFSSNQFEVFYDDMDNDLPETPSYVSCDDDRVVILKNSFVVYEDMTIGEFTGLLTFAHGISMRLFDANGTELNDSSASVLRATVMRLFRDGQQVQTLLRQDVASEDKETDSSGGTNGGGTSGPGTGVGLPACALLLVGASAAAVGVTLKRRRKKA